MATKVTNPASKHFIELNLVNEESTIQRTERRKKTTVSLHYIMGVRPAGRTYSTYFGADGGPRAALTPSLALLSSHWIKD